MATTDCHNVSITSNESRNTVVHSGRPGAQVHTVEEQHVAIFRSPVNHEVQVSLERLAPKRAAHEQSRVHASASADERARSSCSSSEFSLENAWAYRGAARHLREAPGSLFDAFAFPSATRSHLMPSPTFRKPASDATVAVAVAVDAESDARANAAAFSPSATQLLMARHADSDDDDFSARQAVLTDADAPLACCVIHAKAPDPLRRRARNPWTSKRRHDDALTPAGTVFVDTALQLRPDCAASSSATSSSFASPQHDESADAL